MKFQRTIKRVKRVIRIPFEWVGIALALVLFAILPRFMMLKLADFISFVMYKFDTRGKAHAYKNLAIVCGGRLPPDRRAELIVRRSYRNMARTVAHAFWTSFNAKRRVAIAGEVDKKCMEILANYKPLVTVSGHIGCWEILSQLAFLHGHSMMSVAKNIGTNGMTRLLMWSRRSIGQEIVPANGAFKSLMAGMRSGMSLGLLVDQVVSPSDGGMWVEFFGRPHPVSSAPAFFAAKAKVPVVVAWSRPLKDGRYRCEFVDFIEPSEARDIWRTTQRCLTGLERIIRRNPSCWVLNYNCFRQAPNQEEAQKLAERVASAREKAAKTSNL
ncbi:MAG: lysophospholipid acyltransferase family protein [Kiritimatiellae bacterium]|nr:lysophospholipid acyltransferase family protein [Kiritimatiellia bacterium]